MALEAAGDEVLKGGGTVPGALVVHVIDFAIGIEADAAGAADAAAGGNEGAIRLDAKGPATEGHLAVE